MKDFDFGFTIVGEDDIESIKKVSEEKQSEIDKWEEKCDTMYNMIQPLLDNLEKNPELDYIKWDGQQRAKAISEFRRQLEEVVTS